MKGYVGGLGASASNTFAYRPSRDFGSDDLGVSFTDLYGFVTSVTKHINQRKTLSVTDKADVRRFDVKDKRVSAFQLESLILAQNERWRQA